MADVLVLNVDLASLVGSRSGVKDRLSRSSVCGSVRCLSRDSSPVLYSSSLSPMYVVFHELRVD